MALTISKIHALVALSDVYKRQALGLASFTVTGASAGFKLYPELPIFIVLLGTITAVGGGIIRDMLAQRIPSVLKEDVYALPSIIGGIVYYLMVISSWAGEAVYLSLIHIS